MSYIKRNVLACSKFMFSIPSRVRGGVIKCKYPKFFDGRHVVYHMKGLEENVPNFIFLGPRVVRGHQV